jgi:hypothetical protein
MKAEKGARGNIQVPTPKLQRSSKFQGRLKLMKATVDLFFGMFWFVFSQ